MNRKILSGCFGVVAFLVVIAGIAKYVGDRREAAFNETALNKELSLARAEGLPTTWQEYAATIKPAKPDENAAGLYRQFGKLKVKLTDETTKLDATLMLRPSQTVRESVRKVLDQNKPALDLADQAARLPRCWFNRDWTKGFAVLFPELAQMKAASKLELMRADLAASEGRPEDAIRDLNRARQIGQHASEEGNMIDVLVDVGIWGNCIHHLAIWQIQNPRVAAYRRLSAELIKAFPKVDMKVMNRDKLLMMKDLIESSQTKKGLEELGVKPENTSKLEPYAKLLINQPRAKVQVIKAARKSWESYSLSGSERTTQNESANEELLQGMAAFPTAASVYEALVQDDGKADVLDLALEAQRRCYVALLRAISLEKVPKELRTDDLLSPIDQKPIDYKFDGKQIVISASDGEGGTLRSVKVPNDTEMKTVGSPSIWSRSP